MLPIDTMFLILISPIQCNLRIKMGLQLYIKRTAGFLELKVSPKGSSEGKTVIFNKMCHNNLIPLKNHVICHKIQKFGSRVLGFQPLIRGYP